ncbi:MAG: M50 family metallopeptidase [Candidatus Saccharimonadales bacterium]
MGVVLLVIGLILFIGLVVVHEFGHFIVARRNGVEVEEFGLFFPPRLWKKRMKGGYDFTINLLPLGGFVKLKGEHDADKEKGSFGAATTKTKVKIMLAGVGMNLLAALVLFTILGWVGMPKLINNQFAVKNDTKIVKNDVLIGYIEPDSPAAKAGLLARDKIISVGAPGTKGTVVKSADQLPGITRQFAGKPAQLKYIRNGKQHIVTVTLRTAKVVQASQKTDNPKGYMGVEPTEYSIQRSTWSAPVVAVGLSAQLTGLTFQGLGHALAGLGGIIAGTFTGNHTARENAQTTASSQVSGPVGIFVILKDGSLLGYQFMLMIIAIISLTLAIMNVLPIPALDGGRLFILLLSRVLRRQISQKMEEAIYGVGFLVLISLIIAITIVDVRRFF